MSIFPRWLHYFFFDFRGTIVGYHPVKKKYEKRKAKKKKKMESVIPANQMSQTPKRTKNRKRETWTELNWIEKMKAMEKPIAINKGQ